MPSINIDIDTADEVLMQYWPLNAFIATNPLWNLRHKSFFDVVSQQAFQSLMKTDYYHDQYHNDCITNDDICQAIKLIDNRILNEEQVRQWVEKSCIQIESLWPNILLSQQLEEYQFQKPDTWIKQRIYSLLKNYFGLMQYKNMSLLDFWYKENGIAHTELHHIQSMPLKEAIVFLLKALHIPQTESVTYLKNIYLQVYGWASFMNWRNHHPNNSWVPGKDTCSLILLFWLTYEYMIAMEEKIYYSNIIIDELDSNHKKNLQQRYIWQTAFELHYMKKLELKCNVNFTREKTCYDAQFIFCIDTRSEGFRRHLEANKNFQTFGFAGFFGAIFNLSDGDNIYYQAPALVSASEVMTQRQRVSRIRNLVTHFKKVISFTKQQMTAPFALFEIIGFWYLPFMIYKTIQPKLNRAHKKKDMDIGVSFSIQQQFQSARNLLTSIGLVNNFSSYVMICGHQTDTINNPFISSLNCGACGGNSGTPNALVMCDILNSQNIRQMLQEAGIAIPNNTRFIPASHHTTNDRLELLKGEIPNDLATLINRAAKNLRKEKFKSLPGCSSLSEREKNWSELIPELGLINNACIIIGRRELTRDQDLERRAFLHSYDPELDQSGSILSSILSAPAIVAHWINSQYYFSTTCPNSFGAGNKAIHNVMPGIGVLEGNISDLKVGLPLQSTHFQSQPLHEPRRLIVVVYAYRQVLDIAIENSPDFRMLLDNKWLYLKHIEPKP
ncbi:MAG: Na-translocating system protein MpsB [Coxiellaceae bacterium]|nr:Na-translocating system protein MpsB [Coxiellaceae bacterium]